MILEGERHRCVGRASNPVGGATRRWEGSTPSPLRHDPALACCAGTSRACVALRTGVRLRDSTQSEPARDGQRGIVEGAC